MHGTEKKCCLGTGRENGGRPAATGLAAREVVRLPEMAHLRMRPYICLKQAEKGKGPEAAQTRRIKEQHDLSRERVAALGTEEIEERLQAFGVSYRREQFLEACRSHWSAWEVSEEWFARDPVTCRGWEADFLGLAACELWKRFLPEAPSLEMVDDWIEQGYVLLGDDRPLEACRRWYSAWNVVLERLPPTMTTLDAADEFFRGTPFLLNWSHDFEQEVFNASLRHPSAAEMGASFCRSWLDQMVETWPEDPWGHIHYSDAWSHLFADKAHHLPFDLEKARRCLEQALLVARDPYDRQAAEERLERLEEATPVTDGDSCPCCGGKGST